MNEGLPTLKERLEWARGEIYCLTNDMEFHPIRYQLYDHEKDPLGLYQTPDHMKAVSVSCDDKLQWVMLVPKTL